MNKTWQQLDREVAQLAGRGGRPTRPAHENPDTKHVNSFEALVRFVGGDRSAARGLIDEVNDWADNKIGRNEFRALPKAYLDVADKGKDPGPGYWAFIASKA